jgi:hypothetical protein
VSDESILQIAEQERDNTRRLIAEHVAVCTAPRTEPGSLAGNCQECRSLADHLARCDRQVELLGSPDTEPEMEALF